ncbi:MAG: protein translocase subunit SecF, partial [Ornithinimicrobium sp.]
TLIGPGTLVDLAWALFIGIAVGTFSSIFIATPLLVQLRQHDAEVAALDAKVIRRSERSATKVAAGSARSGAQGASPQADTAAGSAPGADPEQGPSPQAPRESVTGRAVHPWAQRGPRNQPKRPPRSRR